MVGLETILHRLLTARSGEDVQEVFRETQMATITMRPPEKATALISTTLNRSVLIGIIKTLMVSGGEYTQVEEWIPND